MKRISILFSLVLVYSSCNEKTQQANTVVTAQNEPSDTLEVRMEQMPNPKRIKLLSDAITKGDTSAYDELAIYHIFNGRGPEFLYHSIIMANKYDHPNAYFTVYLILAEPLNYQTFQSLGEKTKNIAYYYLLKASEKGNANAIYTAKRIFGENKVPKSSKYKSIE
jgi:hypothetical protein